MSKRIKLCAVSRELAGGLSFGAVLLYVLAYALGAGPVPWVYLPEVLAF